MSKKKGKAAPKKAAKAKAKAKAVRRPVASLAATAGKTVYATIFIFRTGNGNRIRTSPQKIYANPEDRIEWTVVNLVDGSDVPTRITWPGESPFGKEPIEFRSFETRALNGAAPGRYKYVVAALDAQEDPEVEVPDGN